MTLEERSHEANLRNQQNPSSTKESLTLGHFIYDHENKKEIWIDYREKNSEGNYKASKL